MAAVVASAMDFGFLANVVRRKWKFTSRIVRLESPFFTGWVASLQQLPINHKDSDGVLDCKMASIQLADEEMETPTRESVQWIADQLILQRQYDIGELS